ncbi:hypothetical protein ACMX2M_15110 [Paenibacillus polymyxa]|uniref:hypothetical protein n=1 Tax=Paenibacillus TaxID=44249 RepID=UPI001059ADE0|nr:hypothetical protein [Paenibacillus amylolyticus]TDL67997.1 hypothetical protein E2R58_01905 [Paenibacillus amylolyticus]
MGAKKWPFYIIILLILSNLTVTYMLWNSNTQYDRLQDKMNQSFTTYAENIQDQLRKNAERGLEEEIYQYQAEASKLNAVATGTTYYREQSLVSNVSMNLERFFRDYPRYQHKLTVSEVETLQGLLSEWITKPVDSGTNNKLNDFLVLQK